ncbi:MAG: hypothetical protein QXR89_08815 [Candidatus Bathyarchaeia archaeon]
MGRCKVCGRQIPDTLTYCSEKCAEADRNQPTITTEPEKPFLTQFDRGHGSVRRETNIRKVAEMLRQGVREEDIRYQLSLLFRPMTVDDYLRTARELLRRESRGS